MQLLTLKTKTILMKINKTKVLIVGPHLNAQGGVSGYYSTMVKQLQENPNYEIDYLPIGAHSTNKFKVIIYFFKDILRFQKKNHKHIDLVLLNPAFEFKNFVREGIMFTLSRWRKKKNVIFFRGWNQSFIDKYKRWRRIFNASFRKADAFIELADHQKKQLEDWGVKTPVHLETTTVDIQLLQGFSIDKKLVDLAENPTIKLLFLARVEKAKGVYELLTAYKNLLKKYPHIHLTIAGDGSIMDQVKTQISQEFSEGQITLTGFIRGDKKRQVMNDHHIYCLPSYAEGMPNSVLEAMAFGMPVVTTPVGGLKDFFQDDKMGYLAKVKSVDTLETAIEKLLNNRKKMTETAQYNHEYSTSRFTSDKVAQRLLQIIDQTIKQ